MQLRPCTKKKQSASISCWQAIHGSAQPGHLNKIAHMEDRDMTLDGRIEKRVPAEIPGHLMRLRGLRVAEEAHTENVSPRWNSPTVGG
jgi:hypothetical protein